MELAYLLDPLPLVGVSASDKDDEMLPVVTPDGQVTGQTSRAFAHGGWRADGGEKPLHPVVHLHIVNRKGEIYLQQRGASKDLLPLFWDTAVGGHVSCGEYISEALLREAAEELHLRDFNPIWLQSYIFESESERELVNVFAIVGNFQPEPDPFELEGGRYWKVSEIEAVMGRRKLTPNFEGEFKRVKDSLLALL